ncbi:hypothetical protein LR48_Vigan04g102200 [Vigna angularis]|uniref:Uncharacterized protein n=1 Tax=Phaseolus angularis TaxID=3914 RepID=A0A0L9UE52_PHAAN|nr:hypothetical protein LR48_Vigan04g102200 [Vigna angularis]
MNWMKKLKKQGAGVMKGWKSATVEHQFGFESTVSRLGATAEGQKSAAATAERPFGALSTDDVKEGEEKDGEGKMVHHDSVDEQLKLGTLVRVKNKLWVVKELKKNGVIEIEAPYSRRVKKVNKKMLIS